MIDLMKLIYNQINEIEVNDNYNIKKELWQNVIENLSPLNVKGFISKNSNEDITLNLLVKGEMTLLDSRDLKPLIKPFSIKIDEVIADFSKIEQNRLDIETILWENIVLEIPISITDVKEFNSFKGDGWEIKEE